MSRLNVKIDKDIQEFQSRIQNGEKPEAVIKNMLRRIYKEQDRDTRHACAEKVLKSDNGSDAHDICMDVDTLS